MAELQTGLIQPYAFIPDGTAYANTLLARRREKAITDLFSLHRNRLQRHRGGCMVRVFPTDYTQELKRFSEEEYLVYHCIDVLLKSGLNPMDLFLEGLVRQFSQHSKDDNDAVEAELEEIDKLRDDFEVTLLPHLEKCIQQVMLNIIRYGFTPLGYKRLDDDGRVVPYVPQEFVVVRLQPSGEYICRGIDQQMDQGPFELFFFRQLTDEERPNSDLATLLPLRKKLTILRQAHDRSLIIASRPYIVTAQVQETKESDDDVFEEERRERKRGKLRERMLRDEVNQGTSTALRFAELATIMSTDGNGFGGAEELSGSGFVASTIRRTHQEMTDKLFDLKTRSHREKQKLKEKNKALEDLLQRCISGQAGDRVDLPVRYQLPEGLSHVGSHLNVRPNALNYDMYERMYQMQVRTAILGVDYSRRIGDVNTHQGLSRSLTRQGMGRSSTKVVGSTEDDTFVKSVILQRFLVGEVLSAWLSREELPMAPVNPVRQSMGLHNFHFMDRILCRRRMKLWLMCNTGHRASDITMEYRQTDPYRTGQAVVVPQPVVPIATSKGVSLTRDHSDVDDEDSDDDDSSWHSGQGSKRARR